MKNYIFGYGSLVNVENLKDYLNRETNYLEYQYVKLLCYRRNWETAMYNLEDIKKYKYYLNSDGQREDVYISFLNIRMDDNSILEGILFNVDDIELKKLDEREKNYDRIEVTNNIFPKIKGKVWTYIASKQGGSRFHKGVLNNKIVIQKKYIDAVINAYKNINTKALINFFKSTDFIDIPIKDLKRINIK